LVVILLIPVFAKSNLLLFGERTYGEVLYHKEIRTGAPGALGTIAKFSYHSIVKFDIHNTTIEMEGAQNVRYGIGEKIKIAYDVKDPLNCMVLDVPYIYSGYRTMIAGFLLIVWISVYSSFKKKD